MLPPSRFILAALCLVAAIAPPLHAQSKHWKDINEDAMRAALPPQRAAVAKRNIVPQAYRTVELDLAGMRSVLEAAPKEFTAPIETAGVEITIPLPYGGFGRFLVMESPIMEEGLAAKYPMIRTYVAQGIDDGTATARIDVTPKGFRAIVLSARGQYYIDPYWNDDTSTYISYYKRNFSSAKTFTCAVHQKKIDRAALEAMPVPSPNATGTQLRSFRLAVGATAEYTAAVSSPSAASVLLGLTSLVTTVNRVSAVYERDLSVRLVLVNNNDLLVFTNTATDGYTDNDPDALLSQNQTKCDTVIGSANYDIGHVFSTGGGGVAFLGVVCSAGDKAGGVTGLNSPFQDPYDIDFVAHEMGHQFGGDHPFNGTTGSCSGGNRNDSTAYEPGSGTTIMAYAGICSPQDVAPNSDDYFHVISYNQITALVAGSFSCRVQTATGNTPPVISALAPRVIPSQTPFALTASASDVNGDTLTYCWEEFDLGAGSAGQDPTANPRDNGSAPIFRSFDPTPSPTRIFPSLTYILNNANTPPATLPSGLISAEFLPTTNRTMNFRVTVRDNRAGGGGVEVASTTVQSIAAAGPFVITSQNSAATIAGGSSQTVTWNVAGTTANGINCANVNVLLSTDGGLTFPFTLASNVANNGSASVTIPNVAQVATTQGRIKVEAVGNIFFDISNANLTITSSNSAPTLSLNASPNVTVQRGSASAVTTAVGTASDANGNPLTVSLANVPADATVTASINAGTISLTAQTNCSIVTTYTTRTYPMTLIVTDSVGSTTTGTVNLVVTPNPAPTIGTYSNTSVARGNSAQATPSAAPADANGNLAAVPVFIFPTALPGGGTASVDAAGVVTLSPTGTTTLGAVSMRVTVIDTCGAVQIRTFTATITASANPILAAGTASAPSAESCTPANNAVDPGEVVTVNLQVSNTGSGATTSALTGTLQTSGGVTPVGGNSAVYGAIGAGSSVTRAFTFMATGTCGGTITASLQLQDGATNYGTVTYVITLGAANSVLSTFQNFDGVTAPALPSGWVSTVGSGSITNWATSTTTPDAGTNAVFATPVATAADLRLTSPTTAIPSGIARIQFRHRWLFESDANGTYDGGVLEISIAGGAFADIITAGGVFISGGYTGTLFTGSSNPIAGRSAWTGSNNAAYSTTVVTLPAAASGQNVQFRWRLACDSSVVPAGTVWRIDTIQLITNMITCSTSCGGSAPVITSGTPPSPATVGSAYTHTFTATGSPAPTFAVVAGTLPPGLSLTTAGVLSGTPTSAGTGSFPGITVRASNGNLPDSDQTFALNVRTSAANYLSSFGLSGGNAALTADPNFDGVFNLMAYGLSLNPTTPSVQFLPVAAIKSYAGVPYVYITFNRSSVATDLTYVVEASADLQSWSTIATSSGGAVTTGPGFVTETGTAPTFNVEVRDVVPVDPLGNHRFLRFRVSSP